MSIQMRWILVLIWLRWSKCEIKVRLTSKSSFIIIYNPFALILRIMRQYWTSSVHQILSDCQLTMTGFEIVATQMPESHMLDSTCHEVPGRAWTKLNILDFEGQTMQHLPDTKYFLSGPIKHDNYLVILFRKSLYIMVSQLAILTTHRMCLLSWATLM